MSDFTPFNQTYSADDAYAAILFGGSENGAQKKSAEFSVREHASNTRCENSPKIEIINPLKDSYISNKIERIFKLRITDDCGSKLSDFTYQVDDKEVIPSGAYDSYNGLVDFDFDPKYIQGYPHGHQFTLKLSVKDDKGKVGTTSETFVVNADSAVAYGECRASGLSGN